mmetsp:Transcript_11313/g.20188  ORF Transcript_11313/g.20188 Transcript_11313/m.20188 type:complete len:323 (-) Transcript_11313:175-1143(-)|eukprot:CAMPEP_0194566500 /NCGR_PEP_ID=MMETSP0292-20121207/5360_1 /TAXON_ID=39354 /ORGANISM="Heterosigma akashiwo, Strain CCMP2393" /LENGTH=322 /DNA_ID=CAMNT_0039416101 /DNA_START=145 /DNA_END=1113 /DNA_ORIENTATION=+
MADWETNPDSLIGERITVLWAKGKRYEGTVSGFSSSTGRHIVTYDDGEVKEYNMGTKTFWLADGTEFRPAPTQPAATQAWQNTNAAGAGGGAYGGGANTYGTGTTTYGAGAYGSDAYSYTRWTPYVTKTPGAETEVAFHLFADSRAVRAGERVLLAGSPAALTDWGDGVPMQQDDRDPNLWHATVALPFAMSDYSKNGIFQFNYFIVTANGEQIREGPPVKSEERLRRHLYHTFRSNYREPRFRGWVAVAGKATLQRFARALFAEGPNQTKQVVDKIYNNFFDDEDGAAGGLPPFFPCLPSSALLLLLPVVRSSSEQSCALM